MEIERKYLAPDLALVRKRLEEARATTSGPHFESNLIWDFTTGKLLATGKLLRLRTQHWPHETRSILTYKAPPANPEIFGKAQVKAREEIEVAVADGENMKAVLQKLGFEIIGSYEKIREEWHLPAYPGCHVALDILPFGEVVEIEAPLALLDAVAASLGLDKSEISTKSYYEIYKDNETRISSDTYMVFDARLKSELLSRFGLS